MTSGLLGKLGEIKQGRGQKGRCSEKENRDENEFYSVNEGEVTAGGDRGGMKAVPLELCIDNGGKRAP